MSVAHSPSVSHSPFSGGKRLLDINSSPDILAKRPRCGLGKRLQHHGPACSISPASTVQALQALFPGMDDKTVTAVLADCGSNIDAAIRKLTSLRLASPLLPNGPDPAPVTEQPVLQQQQPLEQQVEPPTQRSAVEHNVNGLLPQTGDQWVELLVSEMAKASSLEDARRCGGSVLRAFEQFLGERSDREAGASPKELQSRLDEALRENHILKKAVHIQNGKLQEAAAREVDVARLEQELRAQQQKLRALELNNYSLALHLQKATSGSGLPSQRHPDIF